METEETSNIEHRTSNIEVQAVLFEGESDEGLLLPHEERRKRYTAEHCKHLESKQQLILMAFAAGYPVDSIAAAAGVNKRIIPALVAKAGEAVATNRKEFVEACYSTAGRWLTLARMKEGDAKFNELMVGFGILCQRGNEMSLLGQSAEEHKVEEAEVISDVRERVRKMLQASKPNLNAESQGRKDAEGKE